MLFVLCAVYANAQQEARVVAEIAAGNEKMVKNSPFSAEAVSESVQTLADGNRIVRSSTSKLYRNSEGRFRREISGGAGSMFGTYYGFGNGISILDPVIGHRVMLDTDDRTARVVQLGSGRNIAIAGRSAVAAKKMSDAERAEFELKVQKMENLSDQERARTKVELERDIVTTVRVAPAVAGVPPTPPVVAGGMFATTLPAMSSKYETNTEDLGTRDFEGVSAAGTRTVTTIPAGAIGNERAIEISYERWYSKELELVVYSKHSDPRMGEQTYRLTNIVRTEPDPSLFTVPQGYRVLAEPASVYKVTTRPTAPAQGAAPRAAQSPRAISVNATKP